MPLKPMVYVIVEDVNVSEVKLVVLANMRRVVAMFAIRL